jgi:G3E family GTPase
LHLKGFLSESRHHSRPQTLNPKQGVHTLFEILPAAAWPENGKRYSKVVFIGRNLDKAFLQHGLEACCA